MDRSSSDCAALVALPLVAVFALVSLALTLGARSAFEPPRDAWAVRRELPVPREDMRSVQSHMRSRRGRGARAGRGRGRAAPPTPERMGPAEELRRAASCLRSLGPESAPHVPGEAGFIPSPDGWKEHHKSLVAAARAAAAASHKPARLFLGDSIVRRLGNGLPPYSANQRTLALGISGDTTANLLWRLRHGELPKGLRPERVVLLIGTNDFARARVHAPDAPLRAALGVCAAVRHVRHTLGPTAPLVVTLILPRGKEWPHGAAANATRRANFLVRALVDGATPSARVSWVDCGRRFEKGAREIDGRLMPDRTHPSAAGMREWMACLQEHERRVK